MSCAAVPLMGRGVVAWIARPVRASHPGPGSGVRGGRDYECARPTVVGRRMSQRPPTAVFHWSRSSASSRPGSKAPTGMKPEAARSAASARAYRARVTVAAASVRTTVARSRSWPSVDYICTIHRSVTGSLA